MNIMKAIEYCCKQIGVLIYPLLQKYFKCIAKHINSIMYSR